MNRDRCTEASLGAIALCLAVSGATAQPALGEADRDFVEKAAESGHAEVSMGKAAAGSRNAAIRDFGRRMVEEHGRMNDELAGIARRKGVTPPASPDVGSQAKGAVTSVLPGQAFDTQYVSSQLDDHRETLQLLQRQAQAGQDPDLKAFARKYMPVVQRHIDQLQQLHAQPDIP
jgi:putative membrane protein